MLTRIWIAWSVLADITRIAVNTVACFDCIISDASSVVQTILGNTNFHLTRISRISIRAFAHNLTVDPIECTHTTVLTRRDLFIGVLEVTAERRPAIEATVTILARADVRGDARTSAEALVHALAPDRLAVVPHVLLALAALDPRDVRRVDADIPPDLEALLGEPVVDGRRRRGLLPLHRLGLRSLHVAEHSTVLLVALRGRVRPLPVPRGG